MKFDSPTGALRAAFALFAMGLVSIAAAACDRQPFSSAAIAPTPVDHDAVGIVTVITPGVFGGPVAICANVGTFTTGLDVIVTPRRAAVSVDRVTVRLLDGSHVGSPLTFAQPDLATRFGTTLVRAGSSRTFFFMPTFPCVPFAPRFIRSEIVTVDVNGVRQSTTSDAALR